MQFTTATIALLATMAAALPTITISERDAHEILTGKRDPNNFRFFVTLWSTKSCGPNGTNCVETSKTAINLHHDCNGGGCNGAVTDWKTGEGLCNKEFIVCGRHLEMRDGGCQSRNALGGEGSEYAKLFEHKTNNVVGKCVVDKSVHYGDNCDAFGATGFESIVRCNFN